VKRIEEKDGERIGWKRRMWNGEGRSRFEEVVMDWNDIRLDSWTWCWWGESMDGVEVGEGQFRVRVRCIEDEAEQVET
jgi:hypothetical protein